MGFEAALLNALEPWREAKVWRVAFSGGLDSSVLLHALSRLASLHELPALIAHHVHHGLQAAADSWPAYCQDFCAARAISLQVSYVQVDSAASLERAAREARYAALSAVLADGEVLLTGQHRNDQVETLLFRLVRGAGVRGLAAMPVMRDLGRGQLVRPLLGFDRVQLEAYARDQGLQWLEDPSNSDLHFARNYLRHEVVPVLQRQWPQASVNIARAAAHMAQAQSLLDEVAQQDLQLCRTEPPCSWLPLPSLALAPLLSLSEQRQVNALRYWLYPYVPMPDTEHWAGWRALRDAKLDAQPVWRLGRWSMHRAEGRLWLAPRAWQQQPLEMAVVDAGRVQLPNNGCVDLPHLSSDAVWRLGYRLGGEVMQLPGRGRRDLKRLLNEAKVPGFVRSRLPLLYRDEQLIAVANVPELDPLNLGFHWLVQID